MVKSSHACDDDDDGDIDDADNGCAVGVAVSEDVLELVARILTSVVMRSLYNTNEQHSAMIDSDRTANCAGYQTQSTHSVYAAVIAALVRHGANSGICWHDSACSTALRTVSLSGCYDAEGRARECDTCDHSLRRNTGSNAIKDAHAFDSSVPTSIMSNRAVAGASGRSDQ
ncbi:hypothetical protein MRB53_041518 [Persea americana]|nr:hypothetical protein MRB53_041518 [Persea americana]